MKKIAALLLVIIVFCTGCSGNRNEEKQKEESLKEESLNEIKQVGEAEDKTTNNADSSDNKIDYGTTVEEFLDSAPVDGMIITLTDASFVTGAPFATGDPADDITTNVVYDIETVRIKTALVKADGSSFIVKDGQRSDLAEKALVQVYGSEQDDGTFKAEEIIVIQFDYS